MLDIAMGMKQVALEACDNPMMGMMASMLDAQRNQMDSDEFMSALAQFAMAISSMAVSGTVMLTLDENEQHALAQTIEELMAIDESTKDIE